MKKVLYLLDTIQTGGAEKSLALIASYFKEYEAVFVQIYKGDNTIPPDTAFENFKIIKLNITGKYNFNEAVKALIPVYKTENPFIVHSTLFRADIVSRRMKRFFPKIPLINSFVNNSYSKIRYDKLDLEHKIKLKLIQWYDRFTAGKVDLFFSNSETIKRSNVDALKIKEERVRVIFRGREINPTSFHLTNNQHLIEELGIKDRKVLINVSRLLDRKGQLDLIKAMPGIIKVNPKIVLLIVGEGSYREILEREIASQELRDHVFLLGHRKDINRILSISDIFVFPSYYEGLPGALIEAMIAGLPIVCSDIPENKECVDENSAIFFKVGNVLDLKDKLKSLLNSENLEGKNTIAQNQAKEKFDIIRIAKKYEKEYKIIDHS